MPVYQTALSVCIHEPNIRPKICNIGVWLVGRRYEQININDFSKNHVNINAFSHTCTTCKALCSVHGCILLG